MVACSTPNCNHLLFNEETCACHLTMEDYGRLTKELQVEAVRIAALESDDFEVDAAGDVRMREDQHDGDGA